MKKHIALLAAAIMTAATAAAQIPKEYTVAPWHGFSESAVTYSLDDLTSNQLPVALPLFDKYGVKASFNVVTTWVKQEEWPQLKAVVKKGHEVTSHTVNHKNMAMLSEEEFEIGGVYTLTVFDQDGETILVTAVFTIPVPESESEEDEEADDSEETEESGEDEESSEEETSETEETTDETDAE